MGKCFRLLSRRTHARAAHGLDAARERVLRRLLGWRCAAPAHAVLQRTRTHARLGGGGGGGLGTPAINSAAASSARAPPPPTTPLSACAPFYGSRFEARASQQHGRLDDGAAAAAAASG